MRSADSFATERNPTGQVHLRLGITFGTSGAIASFFGFGLNDAVPPVVSPTGTLTIALDRPTQRLVGFKASWKRATGVAPLMVDLLTDNSGAAAASLVFEMKVAAGTLTNPASGDTLFLALTIDEEGQVK